MSRWTRVVAVLMVVLMGFTALVTLLPNVQAAIWTQDSDVDFSAGTQSGVAVTGTGPAAVLELLHDATDWLNKTPLTNPSAREGPAMAYDDGNDVVVLFGGYNGAYLGDTWEYTPSTNTWTQIFPPGSPSARELSGFTHDKTNDVFVLFGGLSLAGFEADTWEYNAATNTWTQTTPGISPAIMASYHLTFHQTAGGTGRSILVGLNQLTFTMQTWAYDGAANTWVNRNPTGATIGNRGGHAIVYDATLDRVVLFGGSFFAPFDDTYEYNYAANTWTQMFPLNPPTARSLHGLMYRSSDASTFLFGGNSGGGVLSDTWRYFHFGGNPFWVPVIGRTPPARHTFGITDETGNGDSYMFGGVLGGGGRASDTWAYGAVYRSTGTYESPTFDSFGANANWNTLSFVRSQPVGTTLRFQTASSDDPAGPWANFVGPDCATNTYYTVSGTATCLAHDNDRYFRVRAYFLTTNNLFTPSLDSFTVDYTVPAADPFIVLTSPADAEFGVLQTAPIFIRFSEPMDTLMVFYTISPPVSVTESWSEGNSSLTLNHAVPLAECKAYTVTITAAKDLSGAPLNNGLNLVPNPFSFVTVCIFPVITVTSPPQGMMDIPLNEPIVVDFSEAMDTATVNWSIVPNVALTGTWGFGDTQLTLTHVADYSQCTMHTVTIDGKDLAGLSLIPGPAPNPFEFHTVCTIPYIVDTYPFNLQTNVPVGDSIWVNFSEPMQQGSLAWTISPFVTLTPSWTNGDKTLTLSHGTPFAMCTVYTVQITAAKDLDGNDLFPGQHEAHAPNPWKFATVCPNPFLVVTIPVDGATLVNPLLNITVQFSERMNILTVIWTITPFIALTGTWNPGGDFLTLSHVVPFFCGPNTVEIQGEDVDGNPLIAGLAPNPWTFTPDCPNPLIMVTSPVNDAVGVALNAVVEITFSEPMNTSTVTDFVIPGVTVVESWSMNNTKLTLTPTAPLAQSTQYTAGIPTGEDLDGNTLVLGPVPNPWRFTTVGISPFIVSTSPADGASGVAITADVVVVFSEAMNTATVIATAVPVVTFIYTWSPDNMTLTLSHVAPLLECVTYTVDVQGQDTSGDPLVAGPVPEPWSFSTTCPRPYITSTSPADAATGVALTASIVIAFSEPMDPATVTVLLAPTAGLLTYIWSNGNQTLTVTHSAVFVDCALYMVTVAGDDVDGNPLIAGPVPNPWTFRAACAPPQILSTVPVNGAVGVSPTAAIVVTFSRAMDTPSVTANFVPGATVTSVWSGGDTILTMTPGPALAGCTLYTVTIAGQDTNANALVAGPVPNPFSFTTTCPPAGPPTNLRISRVLPSTLRLTWNAVPLADRYRVYESSNRFASFPSGWTALIPEPTAPSFDAIGHWTDGLAHFYIVRSIRGTTEGANSSMASKIVRASTFTPGATNAHWFSLPYRSPYARASDIATELGPTRIDVIAKWNPTTQRSILYYYFRGAWRGTDFTISGGDGLWFGAVSSFSWALVGTDPATTLGFTLNPPGRGNVNWVSVPHTGTYTQASQFVVQIEGNTGGGANTKIVEVVKWDSATQSFVRYNWAPGGWTGNNFALVAGDAIYFTIVSSFNWQPSLVTPEVP